MSDLKKEICSLTPCLSKSKKRDGGKAIDKRKNEGDKSEKLGKQDEISKRDDDDSNQDLEGKPFLFTGVVAVGIIKKILLPSACASLGAAAVGQSSEKDGEKKDKVMVKPRDLPIYSSEPAKKKCEPKPGEVDSAITSTVRQIREGTWAVLDQAKVFTNQACDILETGKAHTSSTISYLREEENAIPRYGAIGLGGLAGLVLGLRGGIFKRLLYTTTGAATMAATLYPQEAREYSLEGMKMAKKYIIVGYHFVNGDHAKDDKKLSGRKIDKLQPAKPKKQITDKSSEAPCLCPDKDNKCPENPDPSDV